LKPEPLSVTFAGLDIADMARVPLKRMAEIFAPYAKAPARAAGLVEAGLQTRPRAKRGKSQGPNERALVAQRIAEDMNARLAVLLDLGLGYLTLERSTPTLSPGELQRLRLATQVRSNLFGVVYVLDEPSAGLHPADTAALLRALDRLKASGNSIFVVEHELDVIRHADWIVDVGPAAGRHGGEILYSGTPDGLARVAASQTRRYLFADGGKGLAAGGRTFRQAAGWLRLTGITRNNLDDLDVAFPLGLLTAVTGISGSGKSSLVSQALVELVCAHLGHEPEDDTQDRDDTAPAIASRTAGRIAAGADAIRRLVNVDQKPIGRTPRSNLATYTGLFDHVRKLFAATKMAKARRYDAGRFSFNVAKGRCETCEGEGFVSVELLFMPSVYAPCPTCHGARYNAKTLEVTWNGRNIADVLHMSVDEALVFFDGEPGVRRPLRLLQDIGLGYLRLGQPATELSGGEAQRIKLATELQRSQRGDSLYILDEPTTGLHPADVDKLIVQLQGLVDAGNTVVVVEHELRVVADSDWVIDVGPGAGEAGGRIVAAGTPREVSRAKDSATAPYLRRWFA
jgi:excinuclease ABC subunit A